MKQTILFIPLLINIACAQLSNIDYARKFLHSEISLESFIFNLDTSKSAIQNFITESEKANTNSETRISNGPVEFYTINDHLLTEFGKTSDPKILQILSAIDKSVDGYFSEFFSVQVSSCVEIYPETYKQAIVEQGKDSWILLRFLYDKGIDYDLNIIFENNSKKDSLLFKWADYQAEKYFK